MKKLFITALLFTSIAQLSAITKPLNDIVDLNTYGYTSVVTSMYEAWQQEGRDIPAVLAMCYNNIKEGNTTVTRNQLVQLTHVVGPYTSCYNRQE